MVKKEDKIFFDRTSVKEFLIEKEEIMTISGSRIIELDKKTDKLKKEVEETDKKLRLLL